MHGSQHHRQVTGQTESILSATQEWKAPSPHVTVRTREFTKLSMFDKSSLHQPKLLPSGIEPGFLSFLPRTQPSTPFTTEAPSLASFLSHADPSLLLRSLRKAPSLASLPPPALPRHSLLLNPQVQSLASCCTQPCPRIEAAPPS